MWRDNSGENKCDMTCRVYSVQLLGTKKEGEQGGAPQSNTPSAGSGTGYQPVTNSTDEGFDDLPF